MITEDHYVEIAKKHGKYTSWAVWADEDKGKPTSNIGNIEMFDVTKHPETLDKLNPSIIMVGLNWSGSGLNDRVFFCNNFHDASPNAQDYKIRYVFQETDYYGAYMTNIIKNFWEKNARVVETYLKYHPEFENQNLEYFENELHDLKCTHPTIIEFGNFPIYGRLEKYLKEHCFGEYTLKKIRHYSDRHIGTKEYRDEVLEILSK
jgi:hypothetical protein